MKVFSNTDNFLLSQFEKMCPDAHKYLNSPNPLARKSAESILWGFTVGFITRNDFSDTEVIEFEIAIGLDTCLKCQHYFEEEDCELDPADCDSFKEMGF